MRCGKDRADEYAVDARDRSRLQIALEWVFHPKRRWARNSVTIGMGLVATLSLHKVPAALFILLLVLRVAGRLYLSITGTRVFRRLFKARRLHLTSEGWWFVVLSVGIGTAAINTGVNLLYLILAMMLAVIVMSGLLSETTFHKVRLTRTLPYSTFAGDEFEVRLNLHNGKRFLPSYSLFVEDSPGSGEELARIKACYALKIPPRRSALLSYRAVIRRRGEFEFNGYRVHSGYPFNFFHKYMRLPGADPVLVYPRLYQLNHAEVLAGGEKADALRKLSLRVQGEEDFRGLKEFREGDSPRHIHWVSSARHMKLMVREFEKQRANRVIVVLDSYLPVGSPEKMEALELAISTAASLVTFFNGRNYQTGLAAFTPKLVRIKPGWGRRHYFTVMEALARMKPADRGVEDLAERLDSRELRDSMVFLVTMKNTPRVEKAFRTLSLYSPVVKRICVASGEFGRFVVLPEDAAAASKKTGDAA